MSMNGCDSLQITDSDKKGLLTQYEEKRIKDISYLQNVISFTYI